MLYQVRGRGRRRLGRLGMSVMVGPSSLVYGSSVVPAVNNLRPRRGTPIQNPIQIGPAYPVKSPPWGGPVMYNPNAPTPRSVLSNQPGGGNPPLWPGSGWGYAGPNSSTSGLPSAARYGSSSSYGANPNNPSSANNLALLTQQYYSNPASLTPQQWQQLQAAGVIPGTVPYANAGLVNPAASLSASSGAIDPTTGPPYSQELAAATAAAGTTTAASSVIGTDPTTGATTIFGIDWYWIAAGVGLVFIFTGRKGR